MATQEKIDDRLLADIGRYFDCLLSDREETDLRSRIACLPDGNPIVDEARAVMGVRRPVGNARSGIALKICSVAASLAVLVSLAVVLFDKPVAVEERCMAYVDGMVVTDEEAVIRLTLGNLEELEQSRAHVREAFVEDFDGISSAVEKFEMDGDPFAELENGCSQP